MRTREEMEKEMADYSTEFTQEKGLQCLIIELLLDIREKTEGTVAALENALTNRGSFSVRSRN
jgi:hypothetical protein